MTIISCRKVRTHFHKHKLSATFPFELYQFLPIFDFLMLKDQEQILKTYLPLNAPMMPAIHLSRNNMKCSQNMKNKKCIAEYFVSIFTHFVPFFSHFAAFCIRVDIHVKCQWIS